MLECSEEIIQQFEVEGRLLAVKELKRGHIHDTFISSWDSQGVVKSFVHQKLNTEVFKNVDVVMKNVEQVLGMISSYEGLLNEVNDSRRVRLIYTKQGGSYLRTKDQECWRTYEYVPNTTSFLTCEDSDLAFDAARACGYFQKALCQLLPEEFEDVIPDFTNMPRRYAALVDAYKSDAVGRASAVASQFEAFKSVSDSFNVVESAISSGSIPKRVTHNDLKYNNVLFDTESKRAICVVDLDTCMQGTILYDYGDLLRTTATDAKEDEQDLSKVVVNKSFVEALTTGYLEPLANELSDREIELMPLMPAFTTRMIGIRFLTDYLMGDRYFKTAYPEHNLDRAKNQIALAAQFDKCQDGIKSMLESFTSAV